MVKVTAEDLIEDGNDQCCVCLDDQQVGDSAMKLPCGHLYHRDCVVDWLKRHCTCPNCRYELESDDPEFEVERRKRMKERKPRFRRRALNKLKVGELRAMLRDVKLSDAGLFEKADLVQMLIDAGAVQIVSEPPPLEVDATEDEVRRWPIRKLKEIMAQVGVDSTTALEKSELVDQLVSSGRVELRPPS